MSTSKGKGPADEPPKVEATAESMTETDDGVELAVRLRNPLDRSVHYIADVRAMIFDPATRRLRVQLSDQGREMPPGGVAMLPTFRTIDPHAETVATIRLPRTIVKLSANPSPEGDTLFEEHAIADADAIDLEIGWADTPYYDDPREKSQGTLPVASWEQTSAPVTFTRPSR
jgi:hypothetical protein